MGELLAFGLGVGVAWFLSRLLQGQPTGEATVVAASPETTENSASQIDPAERLLGLSGALSTIGDASAHPRDLASNQTFRNAVDLLRSPRVALDAVRDYAGGANWMFATVACAALCERDDRESAVPHVLQQFRHLSPWPMFYALQLFTRVNQRPPVGALVLHGPEWWSEHPIVALIFKEHFTTRAELGDEVTFGDALADLSPVSVNNAEALLRKIGHPTAEALLAQLAEWRRHTINREFLLSFGRFITEEPEDRLLVEHAAIKEQLTASESALLTVPCRSVVIVGEPRSGKSALVKLLTARASQRGWSVLEASAANLMAGQQYVGQLEERIGKLHSELAAEKRVIWYVPDFTHLASSGTHIGQSATLLDQVLPAIASGRIVLLSETTPAGLTAALQRRPSLRSAVDIVRLPALSGSQCDDLVHEFAHRLAEFCGQQIPADVPVAALHLTRHYLGTTYMPGAALDLLKLSAQRVAAQDGTRIARSDLLGTLSQLTGMPRLVLDEGERVELATIRAFFVSRVIGQEEAVDAVVDRIAMLKAGLTDPARPIGVFLFAGPTGTGKTELAKTLAEFLFGSPERLIRLDMSEFQSVEATRKILGEPGEFGEGQALTDRVLKQPFSVILLDEFEKAHPNAWDLFLQVFDDGRLTDALGETVDFRHCIIILTSNLGSTIQQQAGPGFVSTAGGFSAEHVNRAINQSFRPEFINRLDAVIVFRPLTRALMRGILAKELGRVLDRRGLKQREWAVEWESSALDFLLEKGFSPAMGARPLKRAIDRHLLAPLAATLVEHRFPQGDQFLFVRSDGRAIQVEFVDPDAPEPPAPSPEPMLVSPAGPTVARLVLQSKGTEDERLALSTELSMLEARLTSAAWQAIEEEVSLSMQRPGFWQAPDRFALLSRYALMDRVRAALETARALESRLERSATKDGRSSRDLVTRLASQIYVLQHGVDDVLSASPVEVALSVQPALDGGHDPQSAARWCDRLVEMYRNWAARRHMQWEEAVREQGPVPMAIVSGFGAARILTREAGLHVLEYDTDREGQARAVARVRVAPTPALLPDDQRTRSAALASVLDTSSASTVVRRYRLEGSPLIRDLPSGWRTGRHELVMSGQFDLLHEVLI